MDEHVAQLEAEAAKPLNGGPPIPPLADLLDEVSGFIRRFVVLTADQLAVIALWVAHTHAIDAADVTPFLAVSSPEKGCGKTRLLEVLGLLVANAWHTVFPSEAVLFRKIDRDHPTLLLDETDAIFGPKAKDCEALRSLLNSGNRRGTTVARCVGPKNDLKEFEVFAPRALAGIGQLPDTIRDRSVSIRLARRTRNERIEGFAARQRRQAEAKASTLRDALEQWAAQACSRLQEAAPDIPEALSDRAQDAAEPLLAIADLAGDEWAKQARAALLTLSGVAAADDQSLCVRLLADVREVFDAHPAAPDRLTSEALCKALAAIEAAPWSDWYGKPFSTRNLSDHLKVFDIRPRKIRVDENTVRQGYFREQFTDAWDRYLPPSVSQPAFDPEQPERPAPSAAETLFSDPEQSGHVPGAKSVANPRQSRLVPAVPAETVGEGDEVEGIDLDS